MKVADRQADSMPRRAASLFAVHTAPRDYEDAVISILWKKQSSRAVLCRPVPISCRFRQVCGICRR
jgi:hypothetical protein